MAAPVELGEDLVGDVLEAVGLPVGFGADVATDVVGCDWASPSQPVSAPSTAQTATPTPTDRPRIMGRTY